MGSMPNFPHTIPKNRVQVDNSPHPTSEVKIWDLWHQPYWQHSRTPSNSNKSHPIPKSGWWYNHSEPTNSTMVHNSTRQRHNQYIVNRLWWRHLWQQLHPYLPHESTPTQWESKLWHCISCHSWHGKLIQAIPLVEPQYLRAVTQPLTQSSVPSLGLHTAPTHCGKAKASYQGWLRTYTQDSPKHLAYLWHYASLAITCPITLTPTSNCQLSQCTAITKAC